MRKEGVKKKKKQREQSLKKSAKKQHSCRNKPSLPPPPKLAQVAANPGTRHAGTASTHVRPPPFLQSPAASNLLPSPLRRPRENRREATQHTVLWPLLAPSRYDRQHRRWRRICVDTVQHQGTASLLQMTSSLTGNNDSFGLKEHKLLHGLVTEQGGKGSKHKTSNISSSKQTANFLLPSAEETNSMSVKTEETNSALSLLECVLTSSYYTLSDEVQWQLPQCREVNEISNALIRGTSLSRL